MRHIQWNNFGVGVIFSYNVWNDEGFTLALFFGDEAVRLVKNAGFNDIVVYLSSRLIQPFAALMLCLFAAWVIPRHISYKRLGLAGRGWFETWNYLIRYVTPVLLLVVTLAAKCNYRDSFDSTHLKQPLNITYGPFHKGDRCRQCG